MWILTVVFNTKRGWCRLHGPMSPKAKIPQLSLVCSLKFSERSMTSSNVSINCISFLLFCFFSRHLYSARPIYKICSFSCVLNVTGILTTTTTMSACAFLQELFENASQVFCSNCNCYFLLAPEVKGTLEIIFRQLSTGGEKELQFCCSSRKQHKQKFLLMLLFHYCWTDVQGFNQHCNCMSCQSCWFI